MGKFNFDDKDFEKVKTAAEDFYQKIGDVRCPYFNEKIAFNAKGLRHLKFKSDQVARSRIEQYSRLKLLHLAPEILKLSRTLQGIWKTKRFEQQKTQGKWQYIAKHMIYYEFIAVIDTVRVKVIVKEVEGGEKHFWSIIPHWGIDKNNSKRILHAGDPEHD